MNTRPAWGVLFLGALVVVALLLSPLWLDQFEDYIEEEQAVAPFPDPFYELPTQAQDQYLDLYGTSRQMAVDLVAARLQEPAVVEEPNLPVIDPNPQQVEHLLTGNFVRLSAIREASGTAGIFRLSDGRTIVHLENLDVISGPELHLLLSAYPRPSTQEELDQAPQFEIDLGPLKGSEGNQNYEIEDPTFNIENYREGSIVIYDARYELVFSFAPLTTPESAPGT